MDWFRSGRSGSGNFAREQIENVTTVGADENGPGTEESGIAYKPPFRPPLPHLLSVSLHAIYVLLLRLESERVVRVGA